MKRLYYLTDDIEHAEHIARELANYPLHRTYVQALSQDEAGLSAHQLNSASYLARQDIVHRGTQGLFLGLALGIVTLVICEWLGLAPGDFSGQLALIILFVLFLGWAGSLIGLSQEHHHLACFHDEIQGGRTLLMIDVARREAGEISALIDHVNRRDGPASGVLPVGAAESESLALHTGRLRGAG